MPIYMQVEGIEGSVTENSHKKWIEVTSFNWGVGRAIVTEPGHVADRANSRPSFSDITISKHYDSASPKIFSWSTVGAGKKVVFHFTHSDGANFIEVTLESVIPSGYSVSSDGNSDPSESVSLSYAKIEIKRIPYDDKNKAGTPIPVGYDLATMKAS